MLTVGIDVGSISAKAALMSGGEVAGTCVILTGYNSGKAADTVYARLLADTGHAHSAVDRIVATGYGRNSEAFADNPPNKIVRETLYRFCQGLKVAVEVAIMAADAGLLDTTRDAIAIAGTDEGADTAIVLRPACGLQFKKLRIREILAKPR